jgi:hypothetical protein
MRSTSFTGCRCANRAHLHVLDDRHAREDAAPFRHHREAALEQFVRRDALDRLAHVLDVTRRVRLQTRDRLHRRGLARAVRADQRDQLALRDFEVDALDCLDAAVIDLQALDFQHCRCH